MFILFKYMFLVIYSRACGYVDSPVCSILSYYIQYARSLIPPYLVVTGVFWVWRRHGDKIGIIWLGKGPNFCQILNKIIESIYWGRLKYFTDILWCKNSRKY